MTTKNKKTIYTDPVQRLNPNKGILVNKQTHRDIHKNNINNEEFIFIPKNKNMTIYL